MSTRAKRAFFALGGVAALVVAVVVAVHRPVSGRLLDGTQVILQKVSYGTNHTSPKAPLEGLLVRLPSKWSETIHWRPSSRSGSASARPLFAFWLNFSTPAGATQSISYAIADENGFEACMIFDGRYGSYSPGGFSKNHAGLARGSSTFPRRSKKFFLRLYQQDANGKLFRVAQFAIKNEQLPTPPAWTPQDLPIEQQTNGLACTLVKAEVGVTPPSGILAPYDLQAGEWSEFRFQVNRAGRPSAGWSINEMIISDAAGNRLRVSGEDNGAFNHQFSRVEGDEIVCLHRWDFWPEEPAWKLRVHLERPGEPGWWVEYLVRPKFLQLRGPPAR